MRVLLVHTLVYDTRQAVKVGKAVSGVRSGSAPPAAGKGMKHKAVNITPARLRRTKTRRSAQPDRPRLELVADENRIRRLFVRQSPLHFEVIGF